MRGLIGSIGNELKVMEKRTKNINRIPPYYPINAAYDFEEDVWAYSDKGAENKVKGQYKKCYGSHVIEKVIEVSKADFRGDKKVVM